MSAPQCSRSAGPQHARDWEGFREALRGLVVPPATFLYASVDGEIGTQVAGRLPVRAIETGLLPVTGGSQYYDWRGYLEFEELPAQHGTDLSWLVASTHPTHPDLAQRVTWLWSSPGGSARLRQALASRRRWSFDEVVDLQRERRSARGPEAVRFLLGKVEPASRSALRVHDELLAWAGDVGTDSRGAALYHVFRQRLAHRILRRHAASGFVDQIADVRDPLPGVVLARFLDRAGGSHSEAIVEQALDDTWSYMRTRVSANPAKWTWGRTQQLRPRHAFERHGSWLLRAIGRRLGRGPFGAPGDSDSVWAMYSGELPTEDVGVGPAARYAVDLSDWRHAQVGLAGGQSGYAGEAHYDDALQDWLQARPRPLWMHWNDVTYHGIGTWELTPPDR
jgi:penicillin amidase